MKVNKTMTSINKKAKNSIAVKMVSIGILVLVLLIPASMVSSLIQERENTKEDAIYEVASKWGLEQVVAGPIISIPYLEFYKEKDSAGVEKTISMTSYAHFLPENLTIDGEVVPDILHRGIYDVVVYNSTLNVQGDFLRPNFDGLNIDSDNIKWDDAVLTVGISDMKGINENIALNWNDNVFTFNPGVLNQDVFSTGVNVDIPLDSTKQNFTFNFDLDLNGSKHLQFIPVGKETVVSMVSPWNTPSFNGNYLPDSREVTDSGFTAEWKILHLNRNYPQKWKKTEHTIFASAFGVELKLPIDQYQKSMRASKYAIMLIALTFLIFFFTEVLNHRKIHAIQYILVGLALCLFYTLLVSISEHIGFQYAYFISSVATIALITAYAKSVLENNRLTLLTSLVLVILYGFVFVMLQLVDYALLMGSVGLFIVLAITMYLSRKIKWYS